YARAHDYPAVFAQGAFTLGLTARALTDWLGVDALRRFGGKFVAIVALGDTLTARAEVAELRGAGELAEASILVQTFNQRGEVVFDGSATAVCRAEVGR
ncbi:MAG: MaoC family dehydratase, partial [Dehalococcoidia bacterium]